MKRVFEALREWLALRVRVREEFEFHFDQAAAEYLALGLSPSAARQAARSRCGDWRTVNMALREIGADLRGLLHLLAIYRVPAWPGFQAAVLLVAGAFLLLLSPSARTIGEAIVGRPFAAHDREAIFVSTQTRNLTYVGLTRADFETLHSIYGLTGVAPYLGVHARARIVGGTPLSVLESTLQALTNNHQLRVVPLYDRMPIVMGPARAVWALLLLLGLWSLMNLRRCKQEPLWCLFALATGGLQCATSMLLWAFAMQLWTKVQWSTDGQAALALLLLFLVYVGSAVAQTRWWMLDLDRRCPICLDGLLLSLSAGSDDCIVLNSSTKESICAHGHGVLVENRWSRGWRAQQSPLAGIIHD